MTSFVANVHGRVMKYGRYRPPSPFEAEAKLPSTMKTDPGSAGRRYRGRGIGGCARNRVLGIVPNQLRIGELP